MKINLPIIETEVAVYGKKYKLFDISFIRDRVFIFPH